MATTYKVVFDSFIGIPETIHSGQRTLSMTLEHRNRQRRRRKLKK